MSFFGCAFKNSLDDFWFDDFSALYDVIEYVNSQNDLGSSNLHQARCKLHFATQFGTPPVEPIFLPKNRVNTETHSVHIVTKPGYLYVCVYVYTDMMMTTTTTTTMMMMCIWLQFVKQRSMLVVSIRVCVCACEHANVCVDEMCVCSFALCV